MAWTHITTRLVTVLLLVAAPLTAQGAGRSNPCPAAATKGGQGPTPSATFNRAKCFEAAGRIKTAGDYYAAFLKALRRLDAAERKPLAKHATTAKERLKALGPRVPLLTIELPGDPSDYEVMIDGREVSVDGLEYAQPVDPGEHSIEVELPDGSMHRVEKHFSEGDSRVVRVPSLGGSSSAEEAEDEDEDEEDEEDEEPETDEATSDAGGDIPMRTWAYVAGGAGAAGIVIGAITGGMAIGKKSTVNDNCVGEACNHEGMVAADELQDLAMGSTIGFTVGILGLGAGAALWFLFPEEDHGVEDDGEEAASLQLSPWLSESMVGVGGVW